MRKPVAAAILAFGALSTPAVAAEEKPGRYTMTPAENGAVVRLDTETGAMALCAKKGGEWACDPMPESKAAEHREIERLEAENKALKEERRKLEETAGLGDPNKPPANDDRPISAPPKKFDLPSEEDVDKAFDYLEKMVKKFKDKMKKLEGDEKRSEPL